MDQYRQDSAYRSSRWNTAQIQPPYHHQSTGSRPLSDIREITEPNLLEPIHHRRQGATHRPLWTQDRAHASPSKPLPLQPRHRYDAEAHRPRAVPVPSARLEGVSAGRRRPSVPAPASRQSSKSPQRAALGTPESHRSSPYSIPAEQVPPRSSSRQGRRPSNHFDYSAPRHSHDTVPLSTANGPRQNSPIKEAVARLCPEANHVRFPSKTIFKLHDTGNAEILDHPSHQHPRVKISLRVSAPIFVGGSSVEGVVCVVVDAAERVHHRKTIRLERITVDLLGVEELSGSKRHVFLSLGNNIVDAQHPPPLSMVLSSRPEQDCASWVLIPSSVTLPFLITLPLEVGPPPFSSKHAWIRYSLSATVNINEGGRELCVRASEDTCVLSVYDPEKALVSLPSPLTASDEWVGSNGQDKIKVTAGLHRQVWVSGTSIFVDIHVVNRSHRKVKRLEMQLERIILCYRHTAASTLEMSASQARLFDQAERSIICKSVVRHGTSGWHDIQPSCSDLRTCHLDLPRGHATVKCNKYFEVRYYLNVVVGGTHKKLATIQLPIILIHMNSLDVPTNSVAQVAAAIEEKRTQISARPTATNSRVPTTTEQGSPRRSRQNFKNIQGRAFVAPRLASLDRKHEQTEDLLELGEILERSPRKPGRFLLSNTPPVLPSPQHAASFGFKTPPSNRKGRIINESDAHDLKYRLAHSRPRGGSNATNTSTQLVMGGQDKTNGAPARTASALGTYAAGVENARQFHGGSAQDSVLSSAGDDDIDVWRGPGTRLKLKAQRSLNLGKHIGGRDAWRPRWL